MVKSDLISAGNFKEITAMSKEAVATLLGFQVAHLGINEKNKKNALDSATSLSQIFNFTVKEGNSSVFAGSGVEVMKNKYLGEHGHIAIATNDLQRAISYLSRKGINTLKETAKESNGRLKAIYLDLDVSGFAIHLMQR
jgi:2-dehydro-3-deoxyphosphogluconate aldolase/(4S)-4-hydroxy-2-oxoglutarate aldolase